MFLYPGCSISKEEDAGAGGRHSCFISAHVFSRALLWHVLTITYIASCQVSQSPSSLPLPLLPAKIKALTCEDYKSKSNKSMRVVMPSLSLLPHHRCTMFSLLINFSGRVIIRRARASRHGRHMLVHPSHPHQSLWRDAWFEWFERFVWFKGFEWFVGFAWCTLPASCDCILSKSFPLNFFTHWTVCKVIHCLL